MEFVNHEEIKDVLAAHGIRFVPEGDDRVLVEMADSDDAVHLHVTTKESQSVARDASRVVTVDRDRLAPIVEQVLGTLHGAELLLIPVGKWRRVFDAVAFSLADNEEWQQIDAAATVELNTRDPLLCEPVDHHTLAALLQALISDAEEPDQGLAILTTGAPLMIEVIPDGALRISLGNPVLADEVVEFVHA